MIIHGAETAPSATNGERGHFPCGFPRSYEVVGMILQTVIYFAGIKSQPRWDISLSTIIHRSERKYESYLNMIVCTNCYPQLVIVPIVDMNHIYTLDTIACTNCGK